MNDKLPINEPFSAAKLTKEQFNTEIQKGLNDIEQGNVYSAEQVEEEMRRNYGI